MELDILAFAAHPDDTELSCAGTLAAHVKRGCRVGVIDLTRGELGTRGTPEIRDQEAQASAAILGLAVRGNLNLEDGFFQNDKENQYLVARAVRKYRPKIILANATRDRHPDHGRGAQLVVDATFISGLVKVEIADEDGQKLRPWRPKVVYHFIQSQYITPDFVVDVSDHWATKMEAVKAFKSQFYNPNSEEPETYISSLEFMKMIEGRGKEFGHSVGVRYGEGFTVNRHIGVSDLLSLI